MLSELDFASKQILFLVTKEGQKLSFRNDNVLITDKSGKVIHQSTCYRLFAIFIVGHITITSGLIQRAKKFGFAIVFMTSSFRMYQFLSASAEGNVMLRKKQYEYHSLLSAQNIVRNKMQNQRALIMQIRKKEETHLKAVQSIDEYMTQIDSVESIRSLMGLEGAASRVYFRSYFDNITWRGRKPRIRPDMVNSLLDIGYTVLFAYVDSLLAVYGFDRYVGVLHQQFYMRKSLVCDLVEPFRVLIDRQVKKGINLGQFKERDFQVFENRWCLKYEKSSEYGSVFLSAIIEHKTEIFAYVRAYYRAVMKGTQDDCFPQWRL